MFDKWDLKEGHDAYAFMEKMVTDKSIAKVVIIADKVYTEKADGRAGGVGTETQIISREVYESQEQSKFVLVVAQRDEEGKPYLPTYYKGRIFIDMSSEDRHAEGFDKLLRWIYDKPVHVRPELGKVPAFLSEKNPISSGTSAQFQRANDAIKNNKPHAAGAVEDYFNTFAANLERFRIDVSMGDDEFTEDVMKSIELMLPARNEFIQLVSSICMYAPTEDMGVKLHRFFERVFPYMFVPPNAGRWKTWDFDNFCFFIKELFLYSVGISLHNEKFIVANEMISKSYFSKEYASNGEAALTSYAIMDRSLNAFEYVNKKTNSRKASYTAHLMSERSKTSGYDFSVLMQADLLLFVRSHQDRLSVRWWAETLIYAPRHLPFAVFARCESKSYFSKIAPLFGISSKEELKPLIDVVTDNPQQFHWGSMRANPISRLGFDSWCAKP